MSFDLQKMLHRKGEFETARLDDFAFRLRARTMRGLADALGLDPDALAARITQGEDVAILADLIAEGRDAETVHAAYRRARAEADAELRRTMGNPDPVRLA